MSQSSADVARKRAHDEGTSESPVKKKEDNEANGEMSLSKSPLLIGYDREIDGKNEDCFNILGLPTELISHTFSFLDMKDRLRASVNKRLDIELESKYHVESLLIEEAVEEEEEKEEE
ncbi:hypothetical protein PENTCL1PPCAC_12545, partial [Pristionchus entomophagus]